MGKKYKTSEAIAMLEKNPRLKFKSTDKPVYGNVCLWAKVNLIVITADDTDYNLSRNCSINSEWELIQQPVDFIEAVKAYSEGKTIRCEICDCHIIHKFDKRSRQLISNNGWTPDASTILTASWFVEESTDE